MAVDKSRLGERRKSLKRQKLLYEIHCVGCESNREKNTPKFCGGCGIYEEFNQIGQVLNGTLNERNVDEFEVVDWSDPVECS